MESDGRVVEVGVNAGELVIIMIARWVSSSLLSFDLLLTCFDICISVARRDLQHFTNWVSSMDC